MKNLGASEVCKFPIYILFTCSTCNFIIHRIGRCRWELPDGSAPIDWDLPAEALEIWVPAAVAGLRLCTKALEKLNAERERERERAWRKDLRRKHRTHFGGVKDCQSRSWWVSLFLVSVNVNRGLANHGWLNPDHAPKWSMATTTNLAVPQILPVIKWIWQKTHINPRKLALGIQVAASIGLSQPGLGHWRRPGASGAEPSTQRVGSWPSVRRRGKPWLGGWDGSWCSTRYAFFDVECMGIDPRHGSVLDPKKRTREAVVPQAETIFWHIPNSKVYAGFHYLLSISQVLLFFLNSNCWLFFGLPVF